MSRSESGQSGTDVAVRVQLDGSSADVGAPSAGSSGRRRRTRREGADLSAGARRHPRRAPRVPSAADHVRTSTSSAGPDAKLTNLETALAAARTADDVKAIKSAYKAGDVEASKYLHEISAAKETHKQSGEYIKSMVYGGMDGIITTFSVVSSVAGARLGYGVVMIMGAANLVGDGISMGLGDYISSRAEGNYVRREREREMWETENNLEGEKQEMRELYMSEWELSEADAHQVVELLCRNKEKFVDHMMVEELGLMAPDPSDSPAKNGAVTFLAFLICGSVPLLPYILAVILHSGEQAGADGYFGVSIALTAITLFCLGVITSRFTSERWIVSGASTLLVGGVAAGSAYLISYLLELGNISEGC